MSVLDKERPAVIDDTIPLTCSITGTETVQSHTEFLLRIQRGPLRENTWEIRRRYNDFVQLHETLKSTGIELPLPPKRLLGNMDREFIAERQHGLQVLLDTILKHHILSSSMVVKKFLDTVNYNANQTELALQFVSMFLRSEPTWEVAEALPEVGWRIRKCFFLLKPKDQPKQRLFLTWIQYGPDRLMSAKDQASVMKLLPNVQHPSLYPISHALANENGALTIKAFHKEGSLRDLLCKTKNLRFPFLKKYANPKSCNGLSIPELKQYGRQILEALKFLHDKGLAFHHLHSGNILIEKEVCKLTDIENYLVGLPPFYKPFYSQFRKVHSSESIDVYSFGQLLFEMVYGRPLNQPTIDFLPPQSPAEIRSVLESILSVEACKMGLPTLEALLSHPFFADETVTTVGIKPQLKIPSKLKETFRQYKENLERKLKEEQKVIGQARRLKSAKEHHGSDSERRRRKLEARKKSMKKLEVLDEPSENTSANSPTTPVAPPSGGSTPAQGIPPPPPLSAIPAPPTSIAISPAPASPPAETGGGGGAGRGALLNSIQGFKKGGLKRQETDDKSGPRV